MSKRNWALAVGLCAVLAAGAANAEVIVDATVTPAGIGVFHYEFSVTNNENTDLLLVSIFDAPLADPLIDPSLAWPAGFLASYDQGLGIVDFLADTMSFLSLTTTSGFSFDSGSSPPSSFGRFEALTINGNLVAGDVNFILVAPEPATLALLVLGLAGLGCSLRKQ